MKKIISLILAAAAILTMAVFANAASANQITVEQAKAIALEHANLKEEDVKFTKSELEFDNGRYEYDTQSTQKTETFLNLSTTLKKAMFLTSTIFSA